MSFLQVGSWNIEHLSGASRADRKQSAFALADHIEMAGIDVIALQEIYVTPTDEEVRLGPNQPLIPTATSGTRRNADLDVVCYLLEEHLEEPWRYEVLPNRSAGDRSQLCAVLWNESRLQRKSVVKLPVAHKDGNDNLWDRAPHVVTFSTNIKVWRKDADGRWTQEAETRSITIVPLHMKSNFGGVTKNRQVRAKEAATLCAALEAAQGQLDSSVMLIGDTNVLDNREPAIDAFVAAGFIDLNNNDSSTYWSRNFPAGSPFDRAFVAPERPEFKYTRQYVLKSADLELHDRFLSDHYMIKVSVKDYVDDADPR